MDILDYYKIMDNNKHYNKQNIDKYLKDNNITNIIIRQFNKNEFYIRNNIDDNYHTMFIKKNNDKYEIDIFRTTIRNDDSLVTIKFYSYNCDKNMLIEHIYNRFLIEKITLTNLISNLENC